MTKTIKLFTTSFLGGLLVIYCTLFMWLEVPELFFKVVGVTVFCVTFVYLLLLAIKEITNEQKE